MRWKRLLIPAVVVGAVSASVTPASAATDISPPTISPQFGFFTVGTSVTFAFTETGVGTPVAYQYTLNGGATQTIPAPSGTASSAVVPTRQNNRLIAYAVAADGTVSGGTVDDFSARAATPAADKDLNGDGLPDLLTVGNTAGLAPGLWQATGRPANAYASANGSGLPDLLTVSGDPVNGYSLNYFISGGVPCGFFQTFTTSTTLTPDGTADWNKWTLATLSDDSGIQCRDLSGHCC